ncbi:MAG: glycoside hydrolase family 5 protein [Lachnospiraceae bacterium]|nr:glycoside hydrolase family 5 protein [Lachnospiraceae bacterium]
MKSFDGFTKGVNLGGWLSQCDYSIERLTSFISEDDIKTISSWGVDHVRLPLDYNIVQNEDGTINAAGFGYIDHALEMCGKYGLNTVLDLHKTAGYSFDKGENESGFFARSEYQERFYCLWEEFARRYGNSDNIAFELLNEITDKKFSAEWNRIAHECIKRIRVIAPDTVILVGGYWNNSAAAVKDLDKPYDDRVVYNFHCYEPMPFTHQGATWVDKMDPDFRLAYADSDWSSQRFIDSFREAFETAQKNGTVLYCGEYGVIDKATKEDTLRWYKDINAAFEHYGISRCAWSYKQMDFGLSDERLSGIIEELVRYL